jgi:UDP-glucose 4-epimerase
VKVLITGAAGFIGSNLADALLERGDAVLGLDNLSQGRRANLDACERHPQFQFHEGDVRNTALVGHLVEQSDCVVHLAAGKIPRYSHGLDTLSVNAHGSRAVFAAAAAAGRRVVFASTSDVYGRNPAVPFRESSDLWIGPSSVRRWSYAVSKLWGERLGFAYQRAHGLRFTALRFFGGFGPRLYLSWRGGPQSVFIAAALRGKPMEIHGDGLQTRSFTYISDHVIALLCCLDREGASGGTFNVGSHREIAIRDLAALIWRLTRNDEPRLQFIPYETFGKYEDVRRRVPDVAQATEALNFKAQVGLEEGMQRTIEWQRRVMEASAE